MLFSKSLATVGWSAGFATALCWALYALVMRIGVVSFDHVHPFSFILQTMIWGAFFILAVAGPGKLSASTMRNGHTWAYGTLQILNNIALMAAFSYAITATSATLFLRVGILISVALNLLFRGQNRINSMVGFCLISSGVVLVAFAVEGKGAGLALFLVFVSALTQVLQTFIAENHMQSNVATGSMKDECRVTGYIIAVTSILYSLFLLIGVFLGIDETLPGIMPTMVDVFSVESLFLSALTGACLFAPMMYFKFISTKTIGNHNFLIAVAITPFLTFLFERFYEFLADRAVMDISVFEAVALVLITAGSFVTAYVGRLRKKNEVSDRYAYGAQIAKEYSLRALAHFNNNEKKAQNMLGLDPEKWDEILSGVIALTPSEVQKIQESFDQNIKDHDPITGLGNRLLFMTELTKLEQKNVPFTIAFIDLNKFKPVNDTYGHAVGDLVLERIGRRLQSNYGHIAAVTRLGGDEFCVAFHNMRKEKIESLKTEILSIISEPMWFDNVGTMLRVGGSLGFASFPQDGKDVQGVMQAADCAMYKNKSEHGGSR